MENKQVFKTLTLAGALVMCASIAFAVPPPVAQKIGIYDTVFTNFSSNKFQLCRDCHTPPVLGQPPLSLTASNDILIKKHHALIVQPNNFIVSCNNATGTLPATLATGCHFVATSTSGVTSIQDPNNCFNCHTKSPHHGGALAAAQDCKFCHGSVIDNPNDGHFIPTAADYAMDTTLGGMTPGISGRVTANGVIVQGCEACHQGNAAAGPVIHSNAETHHSTGLGQAGSTVGNCAWCHGDVGEDATTIRDCEACHGIASLHNIQGDSPNAANLGKVVASNEDAGFGHVGNNWDCVGCHYSWTGTAAQDTTATFPFVSGLNSSTVTVGTSTVLTINGQSFVNESVLGARYTPVVTLTRGTDVTTLTPFSTTVGEIQVTLPATLAVGQYDVRVEKSGTVSNLKSLTVVPKLAINNAVLTSQTLTITGLGFGKTPSAEYREYLGVFVGDLQAKIISWSDTKIIASSPSFGVGKEIVVNTLFGKVAKKVTLSAKKVR